MLIDQVQEQHTPQTESATFFPHGAEYSGLSTADKLQQIYKLMDALGVETLHIAMLEEVAWTLNIRAKG